jgi:hypothetical protein
LFRSAQAVANGWGRGHLCEKVAIGPGATITRTTSMVKITDPTQGDQIRWVWWFPAKRTAAELRCYWGRGDLCATAYGAFRTLAVRAS